VRKQAFPKRKGVNGGGGYVRSQTGKVPMPGRKSSEKNRTEDKSADRWGSLIWGKLKAQRTQSTVGKITKQEKKRTRKSLKATRSILSRTKKLGNGRQRDEVRERKNRERVALGEKTYFSKKKR